VLSKIGTFLLAKVPVLFAAFLLVGSTWTARAQIAFDSAATGSGSGTTVTWSHTVGNGNNRILVVSLAISVFSPYLPATSVTYGGQPLTRQVLNGGDTPVSEIWTLIAPPQGAASIVVTHPSPIRIVGGSVSFSGVDQASPIRASNQARVPFTIIIGTISTSVTSDTGDVVTDTLAADFNNPSGTPAAGQTLRWTASLLNTIGAGSTKPGDAGSTTMTWNVVSGGTEFPANFALSAISLIPAAALTRQQMIENLIETIQAYNPRLPQGIENSLLSKLNNALAALGRGDTADARELLQAFINEVQAQGGKKISEVQADELIAAANEILAA
jgi:FIMAH domain-containing protein